MILDPMGGILCVGSCSLLSLRGFTTDRFFMGRMSRLTNDGNAILREIEVAHPAAKSMIELSRTQDEEVGDGTTSVIILGESIALQNQGRSSKSLHCAGQVKAI